MAGDLRSKVLKALQQEAYDCKPQELTKLLERFAQDEEALKVIEKGVSSCLGDEDRGSYCESASSGYYDAAKKREIFDKWLVANGERLMGGFKKAAAPVNDDVDGLRAQVTDLVERVRKLEAETGRFRPFGPGGRL